MGRKAKSGGVPPKHNANGADEAPETNPCVSEHALIHSIPSYQENADSVPWSPEDDTTDEPFTFAQDQDQHDSHTKSEPDQFQLICSTNALLVKYITFRACLLANLQAQLTSSEWNRFKVNKICPVSEQQAEELLKIGLNEAMQDESNFHVLPASEACLLVLTDLPSTVLQHAIDSGQIRPNMTPDECHAVVREYENMLDLRILLQEPEPRVLKSSPMS